MNSQHLVEEKLKAPDEAGPDPNEGQRSPNLVKAMNSQHLVEEELKAHVKEGQTKMEDRYHKIWWRP